MRPHGEVERPDVGPKVAQLLLTRSFDLFQIVIILLHNSTIGDLLQDGRDRHGRIGAEIGQPAMRFLHQHHSDATFRRFVSGFEGLDLLDDFFAVLPAGYLLPAALLPSPLDKADAVFAVGPRTATT